MDPSCPQQSNIPTSLDSKLWDFNLQPPLADPKNPLVHRTSLAFFPQTRTKCTISCWTHYIKLNSKKGLLLSLLSTYIQGQNLTLAMQGQIPHARHTILSMALQHKVHLWSSWYRQLWGSSFEQITGLRFSFPLLFNIRTPSKRLQAPLRSTVQMSSAEQSTQNTQGHTYKNSSTKESDAVL